MFSAEALNDSCSCRSVCLGSENTALEYSVQCCQCHSDYDPGPRDTATLARGIVCGAVLRTRDQR